MKRILSIDGGGMHGIKPAAWCQVIEGVSGKSCNEVFDLIVGTSTGAVLAGALGLSIPAHKIAQLYIERGKDIFKDPKELPVTLRKPKYRGTPMRTVLQEYYQTQAGPAVLGDARTRIVITAYKFERRGNGAWRPAFFKSWMAHERNILMVDAVQASSQAPTYHPMHQIANDAGEPDYYIDGGIFAPNPSMCALVEGLSLWPGLGVEEDLEFISMGTGENPRHSQAKSHAGLVWWASNLVGVFLDGMNDAVDYQMNALAKVLPRLKYIRLQVETSPKRADEIREKQLNAEARKAAQLVNAHDDFRKFLESLS